MNKKYFVVSDIHSFYEETVEALTKAGYDRKNKNHILIVNGDIFDRGPDSKKMYRFLKSLPKSRRIFIKGNHELLFLSALEKELPGVHDISNGTVKSLCQLANADEAIFRMFHTSFFSYYSDEYLLDKAKEEWNKILNNKLVKEIAEWLKTDEWLDFYELDNFIFAHSFIPLHVTRRETYDRYEYLYEYYENWRTEATEVELYESKWGCPWEKYREGFFSSEENKGKTLVVGHWHTRDFYKNLRGEHNYNGTDIYFSKGIIALDGGVYRLGGELYYPCNVLVIENGICFDGDGKELVEPKKVFTTDDLLMVEGL